MGWFFEAIKQTEWSYSGWEHLNKNFRFSIKLCFVLQNLIQNKAFKWFDLLIIFNALESFNLTLGLEVNKQNQSWNATCSGRAGFLRFQPMSRFCHFTLLLKQLINGLSEKWSWSFSWHFFINFLGIWILITTRPACLSSFRSHEWSLFGSSNSLWNYRSVRSICEFEIWDWMFWIHFEQSLLCFELSTSPTSTIFSVFFQQRLVGDFLVIFEPNATKAVEPSFALTLT